MSEHGTPAIKSADDPAFQLPASLASLSIPMCIGGLAALVVGWAIGFYVNTTFAMSVYLTAFMYCLSIALGCLFFVLIQHLSRAGWSAVVRRVAELVMFMVIPLAFLFLPILATFLFGEGSSLYRWNNPEYATVNSLPPDAWGEKSRWLSSGWFMVRAVVYFAIWAGLAIYFFRGSVEQDETGEKATTDRLQYWSGPAIYLFAGSLTMAAFDWVMSLSPMWFSTMFGVYIFAGGILAAHCVIAVGCFVLQKNGALRDEVTVEHYHDLGKYIFGFITFWAYIAFSQYMLIWYGNIPEETEWIYDRQLGAWGIAGLALIFFHWMVPFLGTMSRHVRRKPPLVCFWAVFILVMHYVDVYWMIMPEARGIEAGSHATAGGAVGILASIVCVVGMVALMIGLILQLAQQTKIIAVRDPRLQESIAFENI